MALGRAPRLLVDVLSIMIKKVRRIKSKKSKGGGEFQKGCGIPKRLCLQGAGTAFGDFVPKRLCLLGAGTAFLQFPAKQGSALAASQAPGIPKRKKAVPVMLRPSASSRARTQRTGQAQPGLARPVAER